MTPWSNGDRQPLRPLGWRARVHLESALLLALKTALPPALMRWNAGKSSVGRAVEAQMAGFAFTSDLARCPLLPLLTWETRPRSADIPFANGNDVRIPRVPVG